MCKGSRLSLTFGESDDLKTRKCQQAHRFWPATIQKDAQRSPQEAHMPAGGRQLPPRRAAMTGFTKSEGEPHSSGEV
jgi:hypothetical protein